MQVSNEIEQHVWVVEEDGKFLKLLEVLFSNQSNLHLVFRSTIYFLSIKVVGNYIHLGSVLVFVDKQEHADGLLKVWQRILVLIRIFQSEV